MKEYNGAMLQYFHWFTPSDGQLWNNFTKEAPELAKAGITSVWFPPAYKGAGGDQDTGYGVYDLFDLGEFDQKGTIRTKYGTHDEYIEAIKAAHDAGIQVYADIVLNHKMGGDNEEEFNATPHNPNNRNEAIGQMQKIKAWTNFTFPGRNGKYSQLQWHWWHFNAVDYNSYNNNDKAVYLLEGKNFHINVDLEYGNYDFLMGCNLDIDSPDVQQELFHWGKWYFEKTGVDGFRFDAVKHVKADFFLDWLEHVRKSTQKNLFAVGEYWSAVGTALEHFINTTENNIMLFDTGLHFSFADASKKGKDYDLRTIFDNSLVKNKPDMAVTLVSNHDTQPLQSLESVVEAWFKPLAYSLILLRRGGYPCIFAADYYGAEYNGTGKDGNTYEISMPSHQWIINRFLEARAKYAFGDEYDYFDDPHCIGWTRTGNEEHPGGLAVVISNEPDGVKSMQTSSPKTTYIDCTEHIKEPVETNQDGWGQFRCTPGSVSVWIPK